MDGNSAKSQVDECELHVDFLTGIIDVYQSWGIGFINTVSGLEGPQMAVRLATLTVAMQYLLNGELDNAEDAMASLDKSLRDSMGYVDPNSPAMGKPHERVTA